MKIIRIYYKRNKNKFVASSIGYAGLIPFILLLIGLWILPERHHILLENSFLFYLSLIICFLGSMYWGRAISNKKNNNNLIFILSILPLIFIFLASLILVEVVITSLLYLVLLNLIYFVENYKKKFLNIPDWYLRLRRRLNFLLSLIIIIFILN